jgi:hypothetical protein
MGFRISALDVAQFSHLFKLSEEELAVLGVHRMVVTDHPGFPCRVSLRDVEVGETVLLLNYEHLDAATPYRASHAIFVGEGASPAVPGSDEIPESISSRLMSVRAFDAEGMMRDADVVEGKALAPVLQRLFEDQEVEFLHLHNARRGCYAARVDRV